MSKKVANAGGQAVIEGVMMRTPDYFVVAVRKPDKKIKVRSKKWTNIFPKLFKKPFLRGALVLYEAMFNGIEALTYSFNESVEDENEKEKLSGFGIVFSIFISFLFAMTLFVAIPHVAAYFIEQFARGESSINSIVFHTLDGIVKIIIFTLYLYLISKMKDVKRLFEYHGAEHKAIYAYEDGLNLTLKNAKKYTTLHPRCGTSFMITVIVISILIFTAVFTFVPPITGNKIIDNIIYVFVKIGLVFPIGGISFELQRLASKFPNSKILGFMIAPGLWFQKITTSEPDDEVLEIGLVSLAKALHLQDKKTELPKEGMEEEFDSFEQFLSSINSAK